MTTKSLIVTGTEGGLSRASSVIAPIKSLIAIIAPEWTIWRLWDLEVQTWSKITSTYFVYSEFRISSTYFLKMNSNMTQIPLVFRSKLKRGTKLLKTYLLLRQQSQVPVSKVATESAITPAVTVPRENELSKTQHLLTKALTSVELKPSKDDHAVT